LGDEPREAGWHPESLETSPTPTPIQPPKGIIGLFADQNIETPSLDEFQEARREMWAGFPREFPDPADPKRE
jgi:hypothetical protein